MVSTFSAFRLQLALVSHSFFAEVRLYERPLNVIEVTEETRGKIILFYESI